MKPLFGEFSGIIKRRVVGENVHTIKTPLFFKDFFIQNQEAINLEHAISVIQDEAKKEILQKKLDELNKILSDDNKVYNKLKNASISSIAFCDLEIEYEGARKHADFVLVTNACVCVFDSRSLKGNIVIDEDGKFYNAKENENGEIVNEQIPTPTKGIREFIKVAKEVVDKELKLDRYPFVFQVINSDEEGSIDKTKCSRALAESILNIDNFVEDIKDYCEKASVDFDESDMYKVANKLNEFSVNENDNFLEKYNLTKEELGIK